MKMDKKAKNLLKMWRKVKFFNVIVLGDQNVGITSIIERAISDKFDQNKRIPTW